MQNRIDLQKPTDLDDLKAKTMLVSINDLLITVNKLNVAASFSCNCQINNNACCAVNYRDTTNCFLTAE